ncbi:hypothetical protein Cantr_04893 [Candida viswanathii]|uniref:Cation-transporting P-type ATPase C-terminal domain-containing protein n=1 Tax=Candida viswanathii TaxID=5486 RepID=A0A367XS80_9ASCO|nr:hypothetical protein Cantr_04893 [Candida viswanathii]
MFLPFVAYRNATAYDGGIPSSVISLDFASILNAIEEGRRMSMNIQKFVLQLLAENVAQAFYLMIGLVFIDETGFSTFPLSPVQCLFVLVITSTFPAIGLGFCKADDDILEKPPSNSIFTREIVCVFSFLSADGVLGRFFH